MTPIVPREREHERGIPLNPTNVKIANIAPDLDHSEKRSEVQNLGGHGDRGIVPKRPLTMAPKHAYYNDQVCDGAPNTFESGRSAGECWYPGNIHSANIHQFRRETM